MAKLFTERHGQGKARTSETLDQAAKAGLVELLRLKASSHWFGLVAPDICTDGYGNSGCDERALRKNLAGYNLIDPTTVDPDAVTDGQLFDLIEYGYEVMALPLEGSWHDYMRHHHYDYDQEKGRGQFRDEVNRIFERNGIAFELNDGEVTRLTATTFHVPLSQAVFKTGDVEFNALMEDARHKFLNKDLKVRKEALEKLWDGFERLKSMFGEDKKRSVKALLDIGSTEATLRQVLEDESSALTKIGNDFMIRHAEVSKIPVTESRVVDYLFQRNFALLQMLLRAAGLGG
jgi:hypothetical protein